MKIKIELKKGDIFIIMDFLEKLNEMNYKKFLSPFYAEYDNCYFHDLTNLLKNFVEELRKVKIDETLVKDIEDYCKSLLKSIELYYKGDILQAQMKVNSLIDEFKDSPAISHINDCLAFPIVIGTDNSEVQFFRARLSDNVIDFSEKEMLHIPFNKREIVKSERFSIPGLPCLYLSNSSYCCWLEMNRPADHMFNVAPVLLDNSQKILNLAFSLCDIDKIIKNAEIFDLSTSEFKINLLRLIVLSMATSFVVKQKNRNFKSEYILSQMIMLACKEKGLDGIAYHTKQADEFHSFVVGVNVALFATYNGEEELSSICDHIEIGDSFNFSMFKQLLSSQTYRKYPLRIDKSIYVREIGNRNRIFPYNETKFYDFDNYLFCTFDDQRKREKYQAIITNS